MDPFCGSGTTGVEALRLGRRFVGIDTNPIALLISRAKLEFVEPRTLEAVAHAVVVQSQGVFRRSKQTTDHPRHAELLRWYAPETADALKRLLDAILEVRSEAVRFTLLAIYSAILKACSSQSRHWGWVCDNVVPKSNEIVYRDAEAMFLSAVGDFAKHSNEAFRSSQIHSYALTRSAIRKRSRLLGGDCVEALARFEAGSIDLIMTSPPYYGVADYVKSQRLSYLWFDQDQLAKQRLGFRDFESLRARESGARSNRHRADSHARYMSFVERFLQQSKRVLKGGCSLVLVVGESSSRVGTVDELISLATAIGFAQRARLGREIKATRRRLMAKVGGEEILVFSS